MIKNHKTVKSGRPGFVVDTSSLSSRILEYDQVVRFLQAGMSITNAEDLKEQEVTVDTTEKQVDVEKSVQEQSDSNKNDENLIPSTLQEEEIIKKKYGGMIPKKPPLISKDHERAFFDSADWALGKQGSQKPKGPLEALRPKLQPTPHQQMRSRRSAYAPADEEEDIGDNNTVSSEDQTCALDVGNNKNNSDSEDQSSRE
ncbi:hypothetical protein LWI28_022108 [Acer negundo]|uniref:cAMP-regulated phosphoprotein 19-related protein n=1 Tax=Acer negundo TaxID=4023 RepID=A0AAD5INI0_ACENE|nr:hypothetical protein LWI28_022108 [Acer negundo]KAK4841887.1 hypothetical protein QYF36_012049 [Acer negundo]